MDIKEKILKHLQTLEENQNKTLEELEARANEIFESVQNEVGDIRGAVEKLEAQSDSMKNIDVTLKKALGNSLRAFAGKAVDDDAMTLEKFTRDFIAINPDAGAGSGGAEADLAGEQVYQAIVDVATDYGKLFVHAGRIKVGDRNFTFIKGDNLPTDTGGFFKEGKEIPLHKLTFNKDTVSIENWYKLIAVANSTLEDARPEDLGAYIIGQLGKSFALLMDNQVASAITTGVTQKKVVSGGVSALTVKDILQVKALVNSVYRQNGKFYITFANYIEIKTKTDSNGRPIFNITEDAGKLYLDGSELVISDQLDSAYFLAFGDLEEAVVVLDRQSFTIERGEKFEANLQLFKGGARFKVTTKIPQALAKLEITA